ncbi:MAG: Ig-like domain-containing protein, partial [Fidelibacterota bacterium]
MNRPEFVASFSEDLASAGVEWQRVEGDTAVGEPKTASVDSVFLTKGDHRFELPDILPYIEEGVPYTLTVTARDLAANEAAPVVISRVSYDFTPPVITDLYPGDSSFVSSPQISYTLNERLREGVVVWTQVGGEADPASPHVADLTGEELAAGPHENITLSESPLLKDGSIYEMSITGTDLAGNVSGSTVVRHIVYDSTPPEIELVYPFPGASVSTPAVSYRLSELLGEATITWEWSGGNPDERAPHVAGLVGDELSSGYHENVLLQNGPDLVDGAVYTVVARGRDLGLKPAAPSEVAEVTFDRSRPALEIASPAKGSAVNSSNVFYTLSETLAEGTIVWTQTGGREDPFSPHVVPLEGEELEAGEHGEVPLVNSPILMDSSVYDIMFYRSDTLLVGNVLFDKTSPLLEVTYPVAYSAVRNLEVSYSLSEELAEGSITWRRTGGAPDETGEHVALLTGDELAPGDHPGSIPVSAPAGLAEGGVYTVVFQGKDRAGNDARSVQIPGIVFDGTAPRFTGVSPTSGAHVNSARVTYTLSETLESGTVTWTRTGGKDDPRSPHTVPLKGDELTSGTHENVLLSGTPALQDSSLYTVTFVGKDMAENLSDTVSAVQVLYDVSPPRIEVTFPSSNTTVASSRIGYRLSESLGQGSVTWTRTGGTEDPGSPHVQPLTGDELSAGWHRDKELANAPELVEGAVYKITVTGLDPAGNEAEPVTIARVAFDATAPVIANVFPEKGSVVNHTQVAYSLSEYLQSGTVTWIRTAGREDPGSPHIASLRNEELAAGPHPPGTLMERPALVDSAVYRILFVGTDAAGNVSDTVAVEGITYDVTPPRLTVTYPEPNGVVPSARLTYLLEEDLVEGRVTWTRTGGKEDPRSPHTVFLEGEELETGEHTDMIPANAPSLTDGCIYTVAFEGKDRAGNEVSRVV